MKRAKPRLVTSPGEIGQLEFNEASYAHREVEAGGVYTIFGAATTAVRVGRFSSLRIINTASAWGYVKIGAAGVTAPTGLTDGFGVPPNSEVFVSTGDQGDYIIADAATIGVYKLVDSIVIADRPTDEPQV